MSRIAVVLFNLGGPTEIAAVKPFLFNLFNDPLILRMPKLLRFLLAKIISSARHKKAKGIYERMGGKSPLLENTNDQAQALQTRMQNENDNNEIKVFVCMRYWHPMSDSVAQDVLRYRPDQIVLLPLYPQYSTTTTLSSVSDFKTALHRHMTDTIPTHEIGCYPDEDLLIDALVDLAIPCIQRATAHSRPMLLLSAHGLPQSIIDDGDPYQLHVETTAKNVIQKLQESIGDTFDFEICYQSRVGPKKWIGPSTDDVIHKAASHKTPIVVLPIAFVSDHSETLVELDQDYKKMAIDLGAPIYERVPSLACHPKFVQLLAQLATQALNHTHSKTKICSKGMQCGCVNRISTDH